MESIRKEPGNGAIAFFRTLAAQACKTPMRMKMISSIVDLCRIWDKVTDFTRHLDISPTDLPVEQCPEPRLRPLLLAGHLSHEEADFSKSFDEILCLQKI
ncbi:conserved hypothetical protein [Agrobacterium fabacearum TT111]|nr:conserved hypothetical protein [Agrobacterium fabacearum TT111]